jgi:chaperonin GroES
MKISSIKPLQDYILVKPVEQETTLPSGIVIPETVSKEKPQIGEVIAVGPGKSDTNGVERKIGVNIGEKVMYKKWGGVEVKAEEKTLLLLKEEDLIAVITE